MKNKVEEAFFKLTEFCKREYYKGYDPYDGLNSSLFQAIPLVSKSRLARLIWIQAFKRSPINFRSPAGVKKESNPKALGLFISGYCNLFKKEPNPEYLDMIAFLYNELSSFTGKNWSGSCWGYNFDWQSRAFFQPKYSPTVVVTSFIGNALLDAYQLTAEEEMRDIARSACDFILHDLNRTYDDNGNFAFSYSPLDSSVIYNASLLASRLLSRVFRETREAHLLEAAKKSVAFCCNNQRADGSWPYGTNSYHQWIDNFHTGYNLECIAEYHRYTGDSTYNKSLDLGFDYYINTFFTSKGVSKYYNNSVYPIDIHAPAQLVITISKLGKFKDYRQLIDKVLLWTIENMQSDQGYFYYQFRKRFNSRIPYMRWAQAWMFYALSEYLVEAEKG